LKSYETPNSIKNKKKYFLGLDFKLHVINLLVNSKIFEKISLYLHAFEDNVLCHIKTSFLHILELTDQTSFKDSVKNKIYFYDEDKCKEEEDLNISDKCIFCEETFSKNKEEDSAVNIISEDEEKEKLNNEDLAKCPNCRSLFHIFCLAHSTLQDQNILAGSLIPKLTSCIICSRNFNWSEFVK